MARWRGESLLLRRITGYIPNAAVHRSSNATAHGLRHLSEPARQVIRMCIRMETC